MRSCAVARSDRPDRTSASSLAQGRAWLRQIISNPMWEKTIITIIVLNAITLGLETSATVMAQVGTLLHALDRIFLAIFVVEIGLRIIAYGKSFWRDPWSLFDFIVVAIALIPATESFSGLRALRILRVLRLISAVESMRRVVNGLFRAMPGMASVVMLLALIFYVFSVMATMLYGATFPEFFGTIGRSAYSLFQIMTLESWSMGIVRPLLEVHPFAWIFFVPFILMTSFAVLNLFIGIIVDAMQEQARERLEAVEMAEARATQAHTETIRREHDFTASEFRHVLEEIEALRTEIRSLRGALEKAPRGP
jgi:voltage-gated sodium channel